ncbi:Septal ring factor EnvC, activator of murein hydrolases AmiA and AmiB [Arenibacter palladensis]|uniref:Septal ring factor EnvC, activator of murein hydrolases AmiA and AmiB n=1 Tax=Arenibacter palladensis TaxID=237373 RepID=A0A1M4TXG6_9FLAO|nr:peptidoglycan DD-metalloendopeptidase family protein [Arenibacter palladensis]MDO6604309.1 peptidoglycan DD-metalloendopeptidase family protein [Arenibacter palladensis]SHE49171.1 Septal ring factor EnvC, activator of murein hydrolases AmiA and AmiB [Arenibacter palladensis]
MRSNHSYIVYFLFVMFFHWGYFTMAQTNEQKALESKREQLQKEISEINRLLFAEKKEKGNVLEQMEAMDQKINVRQQLIRVTNQQSNLLNRQINTNVRNIGKLRNDLAFLKEEYGNMIQKSYQNKSRQSRLMFLLSSENFLQAFKRFQYMKQYTQYRKEQGEQIVAKTEELTQLNKDLSEQRKEKDKLVAENTQIKNQLYKEIQSQKELLKSIRKNESKYAAAIENKKKEAKRIDEQIERLIRSAIAASNREASKSSSTTATSSSKFVLTPEATIVANNFSANKGKLIWPVEKGIKRQGFGVYNDAVYPGIKHESNGVIIATDEGSKARAIFEGEVIAILSVPGGNKGVQIKHGNYISTYYNLSRVYVKKGDKVNTKSDLGDIYTSKSSGTTQLKFYLYKDTTRLNPEEWIYQL